MLPTAVQNLIRELARLPGIGPRQARRQVFFLLHHSPDLPDLLSGHFRTLASDISLCPDCFLPYSHKLNTRCDTCNNPKRNKDLVCVVEKESDGINMENTGGYEGVYFVLGGSLAPLESGLARERANILRKKLEKRDSSNMEVILALNSTREGNLTSLYLEEMLKDLRVGGIKITRLGRGLSTGSELEYLDEETIKNALLGRN